MRISDWSSDVCSSDLIKNSPMLNSANDPIGKNFANLVSIDPRSASSCFSRLTSRCPLAAALTRQFSICWVNRKNVFVFIWEYSTRAKAKRTPSQNAKMGRASVREKVGKDG